MDNTFEFTIESLTSASIFCYVSLLVVCVRYSQSCTVLGVVLGVVLVESLFSDCLKGVHSVVSISLKYSFKEFCW